MEISRSLEFLAWWKTGEAAAADDTDYLDSKLLHADPPECVPEHLIIMVNGIIGSPDDWKFAAERFADRFPEEVIVHRSECNHSTLTFDGVDLMGERLAAEVLSVKSQTPGLTKISFVAHSLGGLVARYAIGKLYEPLADEKSTHSSMADALTKSSNPGLVAGLKPMNFITFATPHLGSRGPKQLPLLLGVPFLERSASLAAHIIAGRTGSHLFLTDDDDDGHLPLLLRMVSDSKDLRFSSALCSFFRRVAYSNANYDYVVGWRTSSIRRQQELPNVDLSVKNEQYPHVIFVDKGGADSAGDGSANQGNPHEVDLEERMLRGLTRAPWERVDVSFQGSHQRYVAHSTIQVKSLWINSEGADVILHMIDNFLV